MKLTISRVFVPIIWTAFMLNFITNNDFFMYLLLLVSCEGLFICIANKGTAKINSVNVCFFILLFLCLLGLIRNATIISLRSILCMLGVIVFFNSTNIGVKYKYNKNYIIDSLLVLLLYVVINRSNLGIDNTKSGMILFLSMIAIYHSLEEYKNANRIRERIVLFSKMILIYSLSQSVMFRANSRTAFFTGIIILVFFLLLIIVQNKNKYTKIGFYIFTIGIVFCISIYTVITSFSVYERINKYSVELFGKNIDSSRPGLWYTALKSIDNYFLWLGTGILPKSLGMRFDSFHNSFIQLLVQNGLVALFVLIYLLSEIWIRMRNKIEDNSFKFLLACMVGVVIYNCFETTLLNNKLSLGLSQWFLMAIGYAKTQMSSDKG